MSEYIRHIKQPLKKIYSHLPNLDIELTERCNNNCIHCCINQPANDQGVKSREMTTAQVKSILCEAADLGCLQVRFTGGEPLLRNAFEELYLYARRLGLKVLIFTNARLITPHLADTLSKIPPLVPIEVTVYGMHKESYEAVSRVPGSFIQFKRGVDLLLAHKIPFVVKAALLPPNLHEMEEFESWANSIPWMDHVPNYAMFFELRARRDNSRKNHEIESLRFTPDEGLAILSKDADGYRKNLQEFAPVYMGPAGDRLFSCGAGKSLSIDAYGRAQPCLGLRTPELSFVVINIQPNPLKAALAHFSNLGEMRSSNPAYLERCALCFLKGLCEQCPAKSWTENGTLDTPVEYLCAIAHTQARWMGWLSEDEQGWDESARQKFLDKYHE